MGHEGYARPPGRGCPRRSEPVLHYVGAGDRPASTVDGRARHDRPGREPADDGRRAGGGGADTGLLRPPHRGRAIDGLLRLDVAEWGEATVAVLARARPTCWP